MCYREHREHTNPLACQHNQYLCLNICLFTPLIKKRNGKWPQCPQHTLSHPFTKRIIICLLIKNIGVEHNISSYNIKDIGSFSSTLIFNIMFLHRQSSSGNIITLPAIWLGSDCQTVRLLLSWWCIWGSCLVYQDNIVGCYYLSSKTAIMLTSAILDYKYTSIMLCLIKMPTDNRFK